MLSRVLSKISTLPESIREIVKKLYMERIVQDVEVTLVGVRLICDNDEVVLKKLAELCTEFEPIITSGQAICNGYLIEVTV